MGSGAADREAVEQQGRRDVLRLTKGQSIKFAYSSGVTGNIGPMFTTIGVRLQYVV